MQEPQPTPQPSTPLQPPASPTSPASPAAPGTQVVVGAGGGLSIAGSSAPADLYQALRAQREVLRDQLESLEEQRQGLMGALETQPGGVARTGIEQQVVAVDARITEVNQQLAGSEREIARVAGIPGAAVEPPQPRHDDGPEEAVAIIGTTFTLLVLFPLALAHTRRIWRRSAKAVWTLPAELTDRFTRLEQTVESVAIEVERISEGQRFVTRVLGEGRRAEAQQLAAERINDSGSRL